MALTRARIENWYAFSRDKQNLTTGTDLLRRFASRAGMKVRRALIVTDVIPNRVSAT